MTMPSSTNSFFNFQRALSDIRRAHDTAGAQIKADITHRLRHYTHQSTDLIERVQSFVMQIDTVRCGIAVQRAIEASEARTVALLREELAGLNLSQVWDVLRELTKEIALYIGGGAVIGGTVGGITGAFVFGAGAIPGATGGTVLGAKIGAEILIWLGLASLVVYIGKNVPQMYQAFAQGFALAWSAGELPEDARGQYVSLMGRATDAFARGKVLLIKAILCAIVLYLSRGQASKSILYKELGKSKLGVGFAEWIAANEAKLMGHPALQPRAVGTEATVNQALSIKKVDSAVNVKKDGKIASISNGLNLNVRPNGTTFDGKAYRLENPARVETTFDIHPGNIAADHRYSGPGKGAVYGATSRETAFAEVEHYGFTAGRVSVSQNIKLSNVLDLTNPSVQKQLNFSIDQITGDSYLITHQLGDFARANGYDGLLAPSARNPTGNNLVIFPKVNK